jgi:hypothetical protein
MTFHFADTRLNTILQQGDVLHDVEGTVLLRRPAAEVADRLLGPEGSVINVGFLRGQRLFAVPLVRRPSSRRRQKVDGPLGDSGSTGRGATAGTRRSLSL